MGFLNALRQSLGLDSKARDHHPNDLMDLSAAFVADDSAHPEYPVGRVVEADPQEMAAPPHTTPYDRDQWRRKLKRIMEKLPDSRYGWRDLMVEAGALGFDRAWVEQCQRDEFRLMIRRVVGDRLITPEEHRRLELARTLIGLPDPEAEAILREVIAEAEDFFGGSITGAPANPAHDPQSPTSESGSA